MIIPFFIFSDRYCFRLLSQLKMSDIEREVKDSFDNLLKTFDVLNKDGGKRGYLGCLFFKINQQYLENCVTTQAKNFSSES